MKGSGIARSGAFCIQVSISYYSPTIANSEVLPVHLSLVRKFQIFNENVYHSFSILFPCVKLITPVPIEFELLVLSIPSR